MQIKIDLGDGDEVLLDEEISAAIFHAARKRHRTIGQIIALALRQKIRLMRTPSAVARIMAGVRAKDQIQRRRGVG